MAVRSVPSAASVAHPKDGKLFAESAARNLAPLCDLLQQVAPPQGRRALELASGTGQHVIGYASRLPNFTWQPSEADPVRLDSINAYIAATDLTNIRTATLLDATAVGWGAGQHPQDLIVLSNLLHLISSAEAQHLIQEAAVALAPQGRLVIYGPFSRGGELTSPGDRSFHCALTAHDPETGYKDDFDVLDWGEAVGLRTAQVVEMPANNLALVFCKEAPQPDG